MTYVILKLKKLSHNKISEKAKRNRVLKNDKRQTYTIT